MLYLRTNFKYLLEVHGEHRSEFYNMRVMSDSPGDDITLLFEDRDLNTSPIILPYKKSDIERWVMDGKWRIKPHPDILVTQILPEELFCV